MKEKQQNYVSKISLNFQQTINEQSEIQLLVTLQNFSWFLTCTLDI